MALITTVSDFDHYLNQWHFTSIRQGIVLSRSLRVRPCYCCANEEYSTRCTSVSVDQMHTLYVLVLRGTCRTSFSASGGGLTCLDGLGHGYKVATTGPYLTYRISSSEAERRTLTANHV